MSFAMETFVSISQISQAIERRVDYLQSRGIPRMPFLEIKSNRWNLSSWIARRWLTCYTQTIFAIFLWESETNFEFFKPFDG